MAFCARLTIREEASSFLSMGELLVKIMDRFIYTMEANEVIIPDGETFTLERVDRPSMGETGGSVSMGVSSSLMRLTQSGQVAETESHESIHSMWNRC